MVAEKLVRFVDHHTLQLAQVVALPSGNFVDEVAVSRNDDLTLTVVLGGVDECDAGALNNFFVHHGNLIN